jgi:hypothetical protein
MGFITYLTTAAPVLGPLAWAFFVLQLLALGAGAYLFFMHTERNPARHTFVRQLATALLILGVVGVLLAVLRMMNVPVLNQHLWFWLQGLLELAVAAYVIYYVQRVLPGLERASAGRARPGAVRSSPRSIAGNSAVPAPPRPVPTTSRRDARRDRKRKGR